MADDPKCDHCKGYAFEPGVYPMATYTVCEGTGKPAPKAPAAGAK